VRARGLVVVFAREPRPGRVKTRLTPPLRSEEAAALYRCMLDDVLATTAGAGARLGFELWLAVHPPEAAAAMAPLAPPGFRVVGQRGADLAARMHRAAAEASAAGASPILIRGSDSPALPASEIEAAAAALDAHDVVVSPDRDGGYNLVGLHRHVPGLFDHIMSAPTTLAGLEERAAERGLRLGRLAGCFDLDTADDLRLLARVRARGDTLPCDRTLAWLDGSGLWHHI